MRSPSGAALALAKRTPLLIGVGLVLLVSAYAVHQRESQISRDERVAAEQSRPSPYSLRLTDGEAAASTAASEVGSNAVKALETVQAPEASSAVPTTAVAGSGAVPSGVYTCSTWSGSNYIDLGQVRSVDGALDAELLSAVGATFKGFQPTSNGIIILYTTARGNQESMDCARG